MCFKATYIIRYKRINKIKLLLIFSNICEYLTNMRKINRYKIYI